MKNGLCSVILFFLFSTSSAQLVSADYLKIAETSFQQKKYSESLEYYNRSIDLGANDADIYFKRGQVKFYLKACFSYS